MSKVLGAKVSDEVYQRVISLGKSSDVLREMIEFYFNHHPGMPEKAVNQVVNEKSIADPCQYINSELEGLRCRLIQFFENKKNMEVK
jgi:hypothetical protein